MGVVGSLFAPCLLTVIMAFWTVYPDHARYFSSAPNEEETMFPCSEYFTLCISPACYTRDSRIWELECQCKGVKEWKDSRVMVEVWLPQLYCASVLMVPFDRLEMSWRRRFFKSKKRVLFFRTWPRSSRRSPICRFCLLCAGSAANLVLILC